MWLQVTGVAIGLRTGFKEQKNLIGEYITPNTLQTKTYIYIT